MTNQIRGAAWTILPMKVVKITRRYVIVEVDGVEHRVHEGDTLEARADIAFNAETKSRPS